MCYLAIKKKINAKISILIFDPPKLALMTFFIKIRQGEVSNFFMLLSTSPKGATLLRKWWNLKMTYFEKKMKKCFGPIFFRATSTAILSFFEEVIDKKILSMVFLASAAFLLTKTRKSEDFLVRENRKKCQHILTLPA